MLRVSLMLIIGSGLLTSHKVEASAPMGVNFQVFYNELSPYGDWVMDPNHGYLWIPDAGRNFQPYATNGYWAMTNFGNTWVSNYDWGWAPFHYGRWLWDDFYGWAWVPGYEWGPAWVSWRSGGGYYGWAPLSPGIGLHVSAQFPRSHWVFVSQRRFRHRNFHRYFVPQYQVVNVFHNTTVINNTYVYNNQTYVSGPDRRHIERATRRAVPVYQVQNSNQPGRSALRNNTLAVYKPDVKREVSAQGQARPARAYTTDEFKSRASNQTKAATPASRNSLRESSPGTSSEARSRNAVSAGSEVTNSRSSQAVPQPNAAAAQRPTNNNRNQASPTNSRINTQNNQTPTRNQVAKPQEGVINRTPVQQAPQRSQNVGTRAVPQSSNKDGVQQKPNNAPQRVAPVRSNTNASRNAVRTTTSTPTPSGQAVRSTNQRSSSPPASTQQTRPASSSRSSGGRGNN